MIKSILISLGVGILSTILTMGNMNIYNEINTVISPPKILFPIVWTILYILMGISSYIIYKSDSKYRYDALLIYTCQLIVNFFWSIIFFNLRNFLLAFIFILALDILVVLMIYYFYKVSKKASIMQIPYLLWLIFATILTYQIYLLN